MQYGFFLLLKKMYPLVYGNVLIVISLMIPLLFFSCLLLYYLNVETCGLIIFLKLFSSHLSNSLLLLFFFSDFLKSILDYSFHFSLIVWWLWSWWLLKFCLSFYKFQVIFLVDCTFFSCSDILWLMTQWYLLACWRLIDILKFPTTPYMLPVSSKLPSCIYFCPHAHCFFFFFF